MVKKKKTGKFGKSDIVLIGKHKYLVYSVNSKMAEILPLDSFSKNVEKLSIVPKMTISTKDLNTYTKVDSFELYCLLNEKNPLLLETLEYFLENEKV